MECFRLPFAGSSRTISLVVRRDEFGELPANLAGVTRRLVGDMLRTDLVDLPRWVAETSVILGDDGQAI